MSLFSIVWRNLRQRWLPSSLTGLSVALGVALVVAVYVLNMSIEQLFRQTGTGYDLLVGPKGSDVQLVMSAIYRVSPPIENVPWRYLKDLQNDRRIEKAIPLSQGDVTQAGNFPIIGTVPAYFGIPATARTPYQVQGDFLQSTWDAVIGSEVARTNHWKIGTQFQMVHGGADGHTHDEKFTVKGVLAYTGTPNDRTVFVHLDGFFFLDGHEKPIAEAIKREADFFGESEDKIRERYQDDLAAIAKHPPHDHAAGGQHHHHHHGPLSDLQKEVTAILVVTKGTGLAKSGAAVDLKYDLQKEFKVQAVNPVQVMSHILTSLVGNIKDAFFLFAIVVVVVSTIGIFVSIYNSMADRKRDIGVMRAIGARRGDVFRIILLESIFLCVGGGILGILLGHGVTFLAVPIIRSRCDLLINPWAFDQRELVMIPIMLVAASLVGFLPALMAYRSDVAETLAN